MKIVMELNIKFLYNWVKCVDTKYLFLLLYKTIFLGTANSIMDFRFKCWNSAIKLLLGLIFFSLFISILACKIIPLQCNPPLSKEKYATRQYFIIQGTKNSLFPCLLCRDQQHSLEAWYSFGQRKSDADVPSGTRHNGRIPSAFGEKPGHIFTVQDDSWLSFVPINPLIDGNAYELKFNYKYITNASKMRKGEYVNFNFIFYDANGKRLCWSRLRMPSFRILEPCNEWKNTGIDFFLPMMTTNFQLKINIKGCGVFKLKNIHIIDKGKVILKKFNMPHLLFQEDFESLSAIFANGGMVSWPYNGTINGDISIVKGCFGNAILIKNQHPYRSFIWYDISGKLNTSEGTIEFWQKIIYKRKIIYKKRSLILLRIIGINTEKSKTDRIELFAGRYGKQVLGVRFGGNTKEYYVYYGYNPDKWHHVLLTWKSKESPGSKSSFSLYVDGKLVIFDKNAFICFDQEKINRGGKNVRLDIGTTSFPGNEESIIIDRLRIWDKQLKLWNCRK